MGLRRCTSLEDYQDQVYVRQLSLTLTGKSTLSASLVGETGVSLSTDDYFMKNGSYMYDRSKIPAAHKWNQKRALEAIASGVTPLVIDNTNMKAWEPKPYVVAALQSGYVVEIVEPATEWKFNVAECVARNKHGVPET